MLYIKLNKNMDNLKKNMDNLNKNMDYLKKNIDNLKKNMNNLNKNMDNLKTIGIKNVYYINLKRCKNRNILFKKEFEIFKETPIRIDAIDGLNYKKYKYIIFNKNINISQQSCAFSHILAIIKAYHNNCENALIFEDDIKIKYFDLWEYTLPEIIKKAPEDFEILQLGISNYLNIIKYKKLEQNFVEWNNNNFGAFAYYINRKGMKKIIDLYYNSGVISFNNIKPYLYLNIYNYNSEYCLFSFLKSYTYTKPLFNLHTITNTTIGSSSKILFKTLNEINNYYLDIIKKNNNVDKIKSLLIKHINYENLNLQYMLAKSK